MKTNSENRTDWIIRIVSSVLFLLFIAVYTNNKSTNSAGPESLPVMIEILKSGAVATQNTPVSLPEFDNDWITCSNSEFSSAESFHHSLTLSNRNVSIAIKCCTDSYLKIKPTILYPPISPIYHSTECDIESALC